MEGRGRKWSRVLDRRRLDEGLGIKKSANEAQVKSKITMAGATVAKNKASVGVVKGGDRGIPAAVLVLGDGSR